MNHRDLVQAAIPASFGYRAELDLDQLAGGVHSVWPGCPPPEQRLAFADQIRRAVAPQERFTEHVQVRILAGRRE